MVTNGMFWKRFYFVVILLSCNCFLLCSNWFCEFVKKLCCCGQQEQNSHGNIEEQVGNLDNNINNNNNLGDTVDEDEDKKKENYTVYKLVFLSSTTCVGKTAILKYIVNKNFDELYSATFGVDFFPQSYKEKNSELVKKLLIWDGSADTRYNTMIDAYLRSPHGIVFVYDITNRGSFDSLADYIRGIKEKAPKECLYFLLGNKLDLKEKQKVTTEEAQELAADNGLIFLGECSAKTNTYIPAQQELYCKQNGLVDIEEKCTEGLNGILKDIINRL